MFSIVIPLYNKAHTIIGTLITVLNQTFEDFEIVIVDDGSTDNGVELIRTYSSDNRISIIQQKNQGVSVARNEGVANARYNYIAFLDGDDEWLPEYLNKMKEAIELFPESEMFCSAGMGRNISGVKKNRQIDKYVKQVVAFDFFENPHVFLHVSAIVVAKQLFNKTSGFPVGMKRNEDFAFLYSAALITQPIYSGFLLSIYVGGVQGQATAVSIYDNKALLKDTITRYNLVYDNWVKSGGKNLLFIVFMKYELRHFFMINLKNKEFSTNHYFLNFLNPDIIKLFSPFERFLIKSCKFNNIIIFYFKLTKLRWIAKGFQRVK